MKMSMFMLVSLGKSWISYFSMNDFFLLLNKLSSLMFILFLILVFFKHYNNSFFLNIHYSNLFLQKKCCLNDLKFFKTFIYL